MRRFLSSTVCRLPSVACPARPYNSTGFPDRLAATQFYFVIGRYFPNRTGISQKFGPQPDETGSNAVRILNPQPRTFNEQAALTVFKNSVMSAIDSRVVRNGELHSDVLSRRVCVASLALQSLSQRHENLSGRVRRLRTGPPPARGAPQQEPLPLGPALSLIAPLPNASGLINLPAKPQTRSSARLGLRAVILPARRRRWPTGRPHRSWPAKPSS